MDRPTSKRKSREREARREAILDAAQRVFSRKAYFAATIDEIAAEAELAKGTLYNYYRDKLDLLHSLVERSYEDFYQRLDDIISSKCDLHEFIYRLLEMGFQHMIDHQYTVRIVFTMGTDITDEMRMQFHDQWRNVVTTTVDRAYEAAKLMPELSGKSDKNILTGVKAIFGCLRYLFITKGMDLEDRDVPTGEIEDFTQFICRALITEHAA